MRRTIAVLCVVAVPVFYVLGCFLVYGGFPLETVRDGKVVARVIARPSNLLNPHATLLSTLQVGGQTFCWLRGIAPFYVDVPSGNRILFLTDDGSLVIHVFDLATQQDTTVDAHCLRDWGFGYTLGARNPEGRDDRIESAGSNILVMAWAGGKNRICRCRMDLQHKAITEIETCYLDGSGAVTNRVVRSP